MCMTELVLILVRAMRIKEADHGLLTILGYNPLIVDLRCSQLVYCIIGLLRKPDKIPPIVIQEAVYANSNVDLAANASNSMKVPDFPDFSEDGSATSRRTSYLKLVTSDYLKLLERALRY